jgi:hypothetical protein
VAAANFSETAVPVYHTTRRHTPEDQNLKHNTTARTSDLIWIKLAHDDPQASSSEHGN